MVRLLLIMLVVNVRTVMAADYCPPEPRTITLSGTITSRHGGNWGNAPQVPLPTEFSGGSYPCEEFTATFSVTYTGAPPPPWASPVFNIALTDANNYDFENQSLSVTTSASGQFPATIQHGSSLPGTLHPSGNISAIKVFTFGSFVPLEWNMTISLTPRPGYNEGGLSMNTAPLVHDGEILHLSMKSSGILNFYKVLLKPGGTLSVTGTVTNDWQSQQGRVTVHVYNAAQQYAGYIASAVTDPQATATLGNLSTYTNSTSQSAPAYLAIQSAAIGAPADLYASSIQVHAQEAQLKMFLDTDNNFNPASPTDEAATYLPGSDASRISLAVPAGNTPIQTIKMIAAYTDSTGAIVAPPAGSDVAFTQDKTSELDGIAINVADTRPGAQPDFVLVSPTASFDAMTHIAAVDVECWDYGGFTEITATHLGSAVTVRLPKDDDQNLLPDGGWVPTANGVAIGTLITTTGLDKNADADASPVGNAVAGDGLTNFEEYRGIVVRGEHRRTDSRIKDVFIDSMLTISTLHLGYSVNLPLNAHRIFATELDPNGYVNSLYTNAGFGGQPSHVDRKAIVVREAQSGPAGLYGDAHCVCAPNAGTAPVDIYVDEIRAAEPSPFNSAVDTAAVSKVLAHEIGHRVKISHYSYNVMAPRLTPMVSGFSGWVDGTWSNIPSQYDSTDTSQIEAK